MAMTRDDFDYAIENTHVIVAPERQIATFGSTSFDFYLISELMDRVDRKSTRLNSSHVAISYAVFCLKKKKILGKKVMVDLLRTPRRSRSPITALRTRC